MDAYELVKTMLGSLSERALRSLHDAVRTIASDPETSERDRLVLNQHLTDLARLIGERKSAE